MPAAPLAARARPTTLLALLLALLLAGTLPVSADVGATLALQSDARERGLSYSANHASAQLALAWDGSAGWYAGTQLARARFDARRRGGWLQAYGGRVFGIAPGLDGEAGLLAHRFESLRHYDFHEAYAGLIAERWTLRLYHSPDYYGSGQRSLYGEANLRWPLAAGLQALGHLGVLRGWGSRNAYLGDEPHGPARLDLRAGLSWQLATSCELQLAWVAASRGGPYTWTDPSRRRTAQLGLTAAF